VGAQFLQGRGYMLPDNEMMRHSGTSRLRETMLDTDVLVQVLSDKALPLEAGQRRP
jgi:hypothetical protein